MKGAKKLVLALVVLLLCGASSSVFAQDRDRGRARGRQETAAPRAQGDEKKVDHEDGDVAAESEVVEQKGEKVKVMRFSGLDISGELRSPQLLYFLNRLRAEFDRPKLPHRSFIPELVDSTRGEDF